MEVGISQAGVLDIVNNNPQIPTQFDTDSGSAIPIANVLEILGGPGVTTTGSGNTVTIDVTPGFGLTITGNDLIPISPSGGNWNTIGAGSITILGSGSTLTTQLTGIVNHAVQVGAGTTTLTQVPGGFDGQVFLAATNLDPAFRYLTSTGGTITYSIGPNALNLEAGASVPTTFDGNSGSAVPVASILNIIGATVAAGASPLVTVGAGNTITINAQRSQALAAPDSTRVGLANFDSASFAVDASGFVTLAGGGLAIDSIAVQATTAPGVSPVVPTAGGLVTINGAAVAAQTIPIQSRSIAVNSLQIEVQRGSASAGTNTTQQGLVSFDSASFSVDGNGWVQLAGGGLAIDSIAVQTGTSPVVPTAGGLVTINGAVVAAGTNPFRSNGTGANTLALEVQISQAVASTDATRIGLANFSSGAFAVDANGFVTLLGGGQAISSFHPDSGTDPVVPTAGGLLNVLGSGSTTTVGGLNTITVQLTGLTNHAVLVGAGTTTITKVGPSASTGQILQNNAAADPSYSTATYPSTTTINQILYSSAADVVGGITASNNGVLISGTTGIPSWLAAGTTGQVLIATTGSPASWGSVPGNVVVTGQIVTAAGAFTYTPTAGMRYVIVELVGGGGGSGGCAATGAGTVAATAGGGSGGYAKFILTAAQVGASLTGSIGAAGGGGAAGNNVGTAGGNTTLATSSAWTVNGGNGSAGSAAAAIVNVNVTLGGTVTSGTGTILVSMQGRPSGGAFGINPTILALGAPGKGGDSFYGSGGGNNFAVGAASVAAATAGTGYGAGAGGCASLAVTAAGQAGAAGTSGIAIFTEFL